MERLEEYADEGSPLNEQSNSGNELVKEQILKQFFKIITNC